MNTTKQRIYNSQFCLPAEASAQAGNFQSITNVSMRQTLKISTLQNSMKIACPVVSSGCTTGGNCKLKIGLLLFFLLISPLLFPAISHANTTGFVGPTQINFLDTLWQTFGVNSFGVPLVTNGYTDPTDILPPMTMLVSVDVKDFSGIVSVTALMPHESGSDILPLALIKGTKYNGTWQGTWTSHDTLHKGYTTTVTAINVQGIQSQTQIYWTDGCTGIGTISLDSGTYSASVGGTFSVTVTPVGFASGCNFNIAIQDNTSGSYTTVPATDTDLDCNGATCSETRSGSNNAPFSKTLKCEAAGTYNIRGQFFNPVSSVSTVTCSAAGGGSTTPPRVMRLFAGFKIQFKSGILRIR